MERKKSIHSNIALWKRRLPNVITWSRIFAIPAVVWCLMSDGVEMGFWAGVWFGVAAISDWFDGYFARKYHVETMMGKFLDPVADKLLVNGALIMMIPKVPALLVLLILSRDILINGLRAVAAGEQIIVAAGNMGKWKTGIQMFAIPAVMLRENYFGVPWAEIGLWALWFSLALSIISGAQYLWAFFSRYEE